MRSKFRNESASQEKLVLGIGVSLRGTESDEDEGEEDSSSSSSSWEGTSDSVGSSWQQQQSNQVSSSSAPSSSGGTSAWPSGGGGGAWRAPELSFTSEYARVVIDKQGRVTVFTGSSSHGQGHETAFAQLASQQLGVPLERITVVWGDTALVPKGIGTFGSRSAVTGGSAVVEASRKLKSKLLQEASQVLGSSVESLEMRNGEVFSKKQQTRLLSLDSLLAKQNLDQISAESVYDVKSLAYSSGVHLCALILDPESGMTKITSYLVVEDCGRIINWAIVDGQLQGGVIHGVGGALLEKLEYDSDGNLLTTSLLDYDIPTAVDSPDLDIFHEATPSKVTLNGAKGVGESGTIGSYAAIMNALNDAISQVRASDVQVNVAPATLNSIYSALSLSM